MKPNTTTIKIPPNRCKLLIGQSGQQLIKEKPTTKKK
jgi:hypothetical protein